MCVFVFCGGREVRNKRKDLTYLLEWVNETLGINLELFDLG